LKYLVYLLIVLNLSYFAWYQMQPPQTPPAPRLAPLPSGVEPLVLLSERNRGSLATPEQPVILPDKAGQQADAAPDTVSPESDTVEVPVVSQTLSVCRTLGPIEERTEASGLLAKLLRQGFASTLREGKIQAPSGYQIYLPAMSAEQAREVVSTLKAAAMDDYFVGKHNRISLGIFSSKGKARIRQQDVRQLNLDALLDARYKTRKVYWIDIEGNNLAQGGTQGWVQIMERYPEIQTQQVSCE